MSAGQCEIVRYTRLDWSSAAHESSSGLAVPWRKQLYVYTAHGYPVANHEQVT